MSKLKLYYHSNSSRDELLKDVSYSIADLDKMGEVSAISFTEGKREGKFEYIKNSYSEDLKDLLKDDFDYQYKLSLFEKFSDLIDKKYEINDKVDLKSRMERDLIKYQALCLVESQIIKELVDEGRQASLDYIEEINSIDNKMDSKEKYQLHEEAFNKFIKAYKDEEDGIKFIDNQAYKDLLKIHNSTRTIFTNIVSNMNSKENFSLVSIIGNIKFQDNKFSSIGKRLYSEWFADISREIKRTIVKIIDAAFHMMSLEQKNTRKILAKPNDPSTELLIAEEPSTGKPMPENPKAAMEMWGPPPEIPRVNSGIIGEQTQKLSKERSGDESPKSVTKVSR